MSIYLLPVVKGTSGPRIRKKPTKGWVQNLDEQAQKDDGNLRRNKWKGIS